MKARHAVPGLVAAITAIAVGGTLLLGQQQQQRQGAAQILGPNYLYIEEFQFVPGQVPNQMIAEAQGWVKAMRNTGEFKSVRLFIHNTGPAFALYILAEPNSWQAIETGFEKFFAAYPNMMNEAQRWGPHTDNLLSEIPVQ